MAVFEVTDATFDEQVAKSEGVTVVDFWAPWCGPCRMVGPVIEELAEEYEGKVRFAKPNVDDNQGTAGALGIRSIPPIGFFKAGEPGGGGEGTTGGGGGEEVEGWCGLRPPCWACSRHSHHVSHSCAQRARAARTGSRAYPDRHHDGAHRTRSESPRRGRRGRGRGRQGGHGFAPESG